MRYLIFFTGFLGLFGCRGDQVTGANMDQVLHFYVSDAAGVDLLNTANSAAYNSVVLYDSDALRDGVTVSASKKTDSEGRYYLEYVAGATRTLQSGSTAGERIYVSNMMVRYVTSASTEIEEDALRLEYEWTSQWFRIKRVFYKGTLVFEKVEGQPNVIRIVK